MGISLKKGEKISLTKTNPSLNNVLIGLGWDPVKKSGGLFKSLFSSESSIDCDASVFLLNEDGKIQGKDNIIYYGNLKSKCGSVQHLGDNLTGDGDGDDEQIQIRLNMLPSNIHKIVFVVNIYSCQSRKQHFGMIQNAFIRIEDPSSRKELCRYNLSDDYNNFTSLYTGELVKENNEWNFKALGEGDHATNVNELLRKYQ